MQLTKKDKKAVTVSLVLLVGITLYTFSTVLEF